MFQNYLKYSLFKEWIEKQEDNVVLGYMLSTTDCPFNHFLQSLNILQPSYTILVWSHSLEIVFDGNIVMKEELPLCFQYFVSYMVKHTPHPTKADCLKCLKRYVKYSNG